MKPKFLVEAFQSHPESWCSLEIRQDGNYVRSIDKFTAGEDTFEFTADAQTQIDFIVSNKNPKHTVVKDGKVIKDTYIKIKQVTLSGQDVTSKINLFSNYYTQDHGTLRTNGHMTYNGTYSFKFRFPQSNHILYCTYYKPKN